MASPRRSFAFALCFPLLLFALTADLWRGASAARAANFDITGIWRGNDDGIYYMRQLGQEVVWYGERSSDAPAWSNVAHGHFESDGLLHVRWADVPKGNINGSGTLTLQLSEPGHLVRLSSEGSPFAGSGWTRVGASEQTHSVSANGPQVQAFICGAGSYIEINYVNRTVIWNFETISDGMRSSDQYKSVWHLQMQPNSIHISNPGTTLGRDIDVLIDLKRAKYTSSFWWWSGEHIQDSGMCVSTTVDPRKRLSPSMSHN